MSAASCLPLVGRPARSAGWGGAKGLFLREFALATVQILQSLPPWLPPPGALCAPAFHKGEAESAIAVSLNGIWKDVLKPDIPDGNSTEIRMRAFLTGLMAAFLAFASPGGFAQAAESVTVFAAASLKNALDPAAAAWSAVSGTPLRVSYAASGTLAKQIEQGAPADLFASADIGWMDYLQARSLVQPQTRIDLLGNALVLVVPQGSPVQALELTGPAFAAAMGEGRLAVGDVASVPAGVYAKAALVHLGLWEQVKTRLAPSDNVRSALQFVARGEAPLGIVYATDARAEAQVRVVAMFPAASHPAIVYPFALVAGSKSAAAQALLDFLAGPAAKPLFEAQGFVLLARP